MSLLIKNPAQEIENIVSFLQNKYSDSKTTLGIIAVSGGIDSALSLTLLTLALGNENVHAVLLPYKSQNMSDAQSIIKHNKIPQANVHEINIQEVADFIISKQHISIKETLRRGNIMARTRMIFLYDLAKKLNTLVCGTENKSEHYLGYFTRFGDAASDIEPISHLYKTQVRQLAAHLNLPMAIQTKQPSAGLWEGQTDELELGFTYSQADQVLAYAIDNHPRPKLPEDIIKKVQNRVEQQAFKRVVPYTK